eukprot:11987152-Prorocentrum_lima.AAC.1
MLARACRPGSLGKCAPGASGYLLMFARGVLLIWLSCGIGDRLFERDRPRPGPTSLLSRAHGTGWS